MKSTESVLKELENKLCGQIVVNWHNDSRFSSEREMKQYNKGIADAMKLVQNMLEGNMPKIHIP